MEFRIISNLWAVLNGGLAVVATACFCDPMVASRFGGALGYVLAVLALISGTMRTIYTFHIIEQLNRLAEKNDRN